MQCSTLWVNSCELWLSYACNHTALSHTKEQVRENHFAKCDVLCEKGSGGCNHENEFFIISQMNTISDALLQLETECFFSVTKLLRHQIKFSIFSKCSVIRVLITGYPDWATVTWAKDSLVLLLLIWLTGTIWPRQPLLSHPLAHHPQDSVQKWSVSL